MQLFEYQAKAIFLAAGIPVPQGCLVQDPAELANVLQNTRYPCVLKAQVLYGGRGKKGLVKLVQDASEALAEGKRIMAAASCQLLIEDAAEIAKEIYVSVTVDPVLGELVVMVCGEGGMEIEQVAQTQPEALVKLHLPVDGNLTLGAAAEMLCKIGLDADLAASGAKILGTMFRLARENDAELVEINPLVVTKRGEWLACDGKFILDDGALFRHPEWVKTRAYFKSDREYAAYQAGFPYLQFDGDIGLMVAGAGLANVVYDMVHDFGGTVASYLEFGGPNYHKGRQCMDFMLAGKPKVVLIVSYGTIARVDVMARGIAESLHENRPAIPIVCVLRGTNEEQAEDILGGLGLYFFRESEDGVRKAVALAAGEGTK